MKMYSGGAVMTLWRAADGLRVSRGVTGCHGCLLCNLARPCVCTPPEAGERFSRGNQLLAGCQREACRSRADHSDGAALQHRSAEGAGGGRWRRACKPPLEQLVHNNVYSVVRGGGSQCQTKLASISMSASVLLISGDPSGC